VTRNVAFVRCETFHADSRATSSPLQRHVHAVSARRIRAERGHDVTAFSELLRGVKETGKLGSLVESIPYLRFLGIGIELANDEVVGKMTYSKHLIGNPSLPALHGGTIGALLESTAIVQTLWEAETTHLPKIG
jgi:hypothetical protein